MKFPSRHIEEAVKHISSLPGIGKRTALRLALHLLKRSKDDVVALTDSLIQLRRDVVYCQVCMNLSDDPTCTVCSNSSRDQTVVCVVENVPDVIAIENTQQYKGAYHVLGGIISPIGGISPNDLNIESLIKRVASGKIKEVILALPATMEGDTTCFYIHRKIKEHPVLITVIARGVGIGDELEFVDDITLGRSIINRITYEGEKK